MKYKVGDVVLLKGTIIGVDDDERPYQIQTGNEPDDWDWYAKNEIFALVSRAKKPQPEPVAIPEGWNDAKEPPKGKPDEGLSSSNRNVEAMRADGETGFGWHSVIGIWFWRKCKFSEEMRDPNWGDDKAREVLSNDPNPIIAWRELPAKEPEPAPVVWHPASEFPKTDMPHNAGRSVRILRPTGEEYGYHIGTWKRQDKPATGQGTPVDDVLAWRDLRPDEK